MEEKKKRSFWESFKIWFGLGALMFGTYCGANMASGVYATTYMVTFGGGWMWVCLAIFIAFMAFFCAVSLNFIRAYKVTTTIPTIWLCGVLTNRVPTLWSR